MIKWIIRESSCSEPLQFSVLLHEFMKLRIYVFELLFKNGEVIFLKRKVTNRGVVKFEAIMLPCYLKLFSIVNYKSPFHMGIQQRPIILESSDSLGSCSTS